MRSGWIVACKGDCYFTFIGATTDEGTDVVSTTEKTGAATETDAESTDERGFTSTCKLKRKMVVRDRWVREIGGVEY